MAEGAVRFSHAVRVLTLLHCVAAVLRSVHQLARKAGRHRLLRTGASRRDQPTDSERLSALRTNLDRHLVGRATDATAADFDARLHIVERVMKDADRFALHAGFDIVESAVDDAFGDGFLTVEHDAVHELGEDDIPELRIGKDFALLWATTTRHWKIPFSSAGPEPVRGLLSWITWDAWRRTWNGIACGP